MLKIAVIVSTFPGVTQTFTYIRLGTLARKNIAVKLYYLKQGDFKLYDSVLIKRMRNAEVEWSKLPEERLSIPDFLKFIFSGKWLNNVLFSIKYLIDMFQECSIRRAVSSLLRFAPLIFWQPDLIHVETSYLIHGMMHSLEGMKKPILISLRGADVDEKPLESEKWRDFYRTSKDHPLVFFHSVSDHVRKKAMILGVPPEKCETIHLGLEKNQKNVCEVQSGEDKLSKVITIARLSYEKGVDLAIRAIGILRQRDSSIIYEIIGDGNQRSNLEDLANTLGLDKHVKFLGAKPNDWVRDYLEANQCNAVYLQPSRFEAFATAILEAMFSGLPVVATHVGGNPEIIIHGVTGLLCKPDDSISMADNLHKMLFDKRFRLKVQHEGYNYSTSQFTSEIEAEKFITLFTRLTTKRM